MRAPESYDPATGAWRVLPESPIVRGYHSTAILMPDGAVWVAGSNFNAASGIGNRELRIEIFEPWYFCGRRPSITDAAPAARHGEDVEIRTPDAADIKRVVLVRCGSVTHNFNSDQRHVTLEFKRGAGDVILARIPDQPNVAIVGYYLPLRDQLRPAARARGGSCRSSAPVATLSRRGAMRLGGTGCARSCATACRGAPRRCATCGARFSIRQRRRDAGRCRWFRTVPATRAATGRGLDLSDPGNGPGHGPGDEPGHGPGHGPGAGGGIAKPVARTAPYDLHGDFLEVCDCFTICPCWTGRSPDENVCTGVFAWVVAAGAIDGVDVGGQVAVSVSTHSGHREKAKQRVMLFVSEGASDAQAKALAGAFGGLYGGPLDELGRLLGELVRIERAPIEVELGARHARLTVGRSITAETETLIGPQGEPMTLAGARLSEVLGTPADVGISHRLKAGLPELGIDLDLRDRSAMRGVFAYRHTPGKP